MRGSAVSVGEQSELEFRVCNDDASGGGVGCALSIQTEGQFTNTIKDRPADELDRFADDVRGSRLVSRGLAGDDDN